MLTQNTLLPIHTKRIKGYSVPAIGFGTYELEGNTCSEAVSKALDVGYRLVDTARMYGNEQEVGWAIRRSSVDRNQIFLTSKVWREDLDPDRLVSEVEKSLSELQVDYLDLALIHWPNDDIPLESSLDALQQLKQQEKILQFGVSNFPSQLLERAIEHSDIFCNQVEYHPLLDQDDLLSLANKHDIALTAYAPLGQGEALQNETIRDIAEKHGKTTGQVILRWLIEQINVLAIPRSSNPEHIESNFDVFDFALESDDHERIANLPKNERHVDPDFAPDWDN